MDLTKLYQRHGCLIRIFARASISRWLSGIVLSQNIHPENSPFLLITGIDCSSGLVSLFSGYTGRVSSMHLHPGEQSIPVSTGMD